VESLESLWALCVNSGLPFLKWTLGVIKTSLSIGESLMSISERCNTAQMVFLSTFSFIFFFFFSGVEGGQCSCLALQLDHSFFFLKVIKFMSDLTGIVRAWSRLDDGFSHPNIHPTFTSGLDFTRKIINFLFRIFLIVYGYYKHYKK